MAEAVSGTPVKKGLNLNLSLGKKSGRVKLPDKRTINLATVGVTRINPLQALPGILIVLVLAAAFSKFAVVDRLTVMYAAEAGAVQAEQQLKAAYKKLDSFGELESEYAHYTYTGMTDEELSLANRADVISLVERVVLPSDLTISWSLTGNKLSLTVTAETLQDINLLVQEIENDPLVSYCTVVSAKHDEEKETNTATVLTMSETEDETSVAESDTVVTSTFVKASITVYLHSIPEEEEVEQTDETAETDETEEAAETEEADETEETDETAETGDAAEAAETEAAE